MQRGTMLLIGLICCVMAMIVWLGLPHLRSAAAHRAYGLTFQKDSTGRSRVVQIHSDSIWVAIGTHLCDADYLLEEYRQTCDPDVLALRIALSGSISNTEINDLVEQERCNA